MFYVNLPNEIKLLLFNIFLKGWKKLVYDWEQAENVPDNLFLILTTMLSNNNFSLSREQNLEKEK